MYNFHKRKTNTGAIEFHHKLFRRDIKYLNIYKDNFWSAFEENPVKLRFYLEISYFAA